MENDKQPMCSFCIVIESHNFKILLFLKHVYDYAQLEKYRHPGYGFLLIPQFQIIPTLQMFFLGL